VIENFTAESRMILMLLCLNSCRIQGQFDFTESSFRYWIQRDLMFNSNTDNGIIRKTECISPLPMPLRNFS